MKRYLFGATALVVGTLPLVGCGGEDLIGGAADDYVGEILVTPTDGEPFAATDYTVKLTEVDADTLSVSGADFTTFEVDVQDLSGTLVAVDSAVTFLLDGDDLQIDYTGAEEVVFNGVRAGAAGSDDTGDTGDDTPSHGDDPDECSVHVPGDAFVVNASTDPSDLVGEDTFYLCPAASISVVEDSVTAYGGGDNTISIEGSAADIWATGAADLSINGSSGDVYAEDDATVTINGAAGDYHHCNWVEIDTSALTPGC